MHPHLSQFGIYRTDTSDHATGQSHSFKRISYTRIWDGIGVFGMYDLVSASDF